MKLRIGFFICTFLISTMFVHGVVRADDTPAELDCLEEIGADPNFIQELETLFPLKDDKLSNELLESRKADLYNMITRYFFKYCTKAKELNKVADAKNFAFNFTFKDQPYHIKVNTDTLFNLHESSGFLLFLPGYLKDKKPGDILTLSEFQSDIYYSPKCSTRNAASVARSKDTDVNRVCGSSFKSYDYYFIGHRTGFFRGLLLGDDGALNAAGPVHWNNYQWARQWARSLASKLAGSNCMNLYIVHVTANLDNIFEKEKDFYTKRDKVRILSGPFLIGEAKKQ